MRKEDFYKGCPTCGHKWTWKHTAIHFEQYRTYDQLWHTCLWCGTQVKTGFRCEPDREPDFAPRCPWDPEIEYAKVVTRRVGS